MQGCGVIVKCSQLVDGTNEDLSCSGVYLGHGVVLTHGTLLVDLLKDKKAETIIKELSTRGYCARMEQEPNVFNSIFKDVQAKFCVILPSKENVREVVGIDCDPCSSSEIESYPQSQTSIYSQSKHFETQIEGGSFLSVAAQVDRIILQAGIYEGLESLMPASQGWKLLEESQCSIPPNVERLIMSTFILLTLSKKSWTNKEADNVIVKAAKEMLSASIPVHKGNFVYIESSPFGSASPSIFLNSLSHGIICNTGPKGQEVLLTDARCITGAEGAPVFVAVSGGKRRPCAVVISPFCWRKGEWLGLTLLASMGPVLHTIIQSYNSLAPPLPKHVSIQTNNSISDAKQVAEHQLRSEFMDKNVMEDPLKDISNSVVCIKCGDSWGSGLVISTCPGVILTCAHVTYKAIDRKVTVLLSDGRRTQGTVIHQTRPLTTHQTGTKPPAAGYSMWDLAVVVTSSPLPHALPLATSLPPQDVGIVVAGFGMFPSWILPTATLSRGVISKVVTLPSSSFHLPPNVISGGSSQGHMCTASDNSNNHSLDDTSQRNTSNSHHYPGIKRDHKNIGVSSHYLMKLGTLSSDNINKYAPVPVVMQTTCAVYAGGSGGPVVAVHPSHGLQVVGLVVCNMRDSNRVTFPHVNLAIPVPTIAPILNTFLKTKDETVLQFLDVECAAASHLWGLTHPSRSSL